MAVWNRIRIKKKLPFNLICDMIIYTLLHNRLHYRQSRRCQILYGLNIQRLQYRKNLSSQYVEFQLIIYPVAYFHYRTHAVYFLHNELPIGKSIRNIWHSFPFMNSYEFNFSIPSYNLYQYYLNGNILHLNKKLLLNKKCSTFNVQS